MVLVSRIATNNGFIAITEGVYGKYTVLYCDDEMNPSRYASMADWVWSTTWGTTLEFGAWETGDCEVSYIFPEDSWGTTEVNSTSQMPVKYTGEMITTDECQIFRCSAGVLVGFEKEGNFRIGGASSFDFPYTANKRTTLNVWENLLVKYPQRVKVSSLWIKKTPTELSLLQEVAIDRLYNDGYDSCDLIANIDRYDTLSAPEDCMRHDHAVISEIEKRFSRGKYSLIYSLFVSATIIVGAEEKGHSRSNASYYQKLSLYFLSLLNTEQRLDMLQNSMRININEFITSFVRDANSK